MFIDDMSSFRVAELLVTFLGLGRSRLCPGTLASVATIPLWFLMISVTSYLGSRNPILVMAIAILGLFFLALETVGTYVGKAGGGDDPSEVVIDEVIGQLLSFLISLFLFIPIGSAGFEFLRDEHPYLLQTFSFVTPVVLFRIYDIVKPGIIGTIDSKMKSPLGIILDDVVAGLFAGLTNLLLFRVLWLFVL
ncbi:MAG: phosphatidylglycerophosphatase A [Rickettsiales bacterium]|jgi:phosphatidylglycerophosphatase A|nr:phosphatidylglycerophosphatase A [Rickettsiales bacterium]